MGFQAIALGNHEFDFGTADLAALIDGSAEGEILGADFAGTNFSYLSTNLDFSTDANLAPLETSGGEAPQANTVTSSVVIDVNGTNVGVVGATTPTLGIISNPDDVGVSPTPFDANPTDAQLDALAAEIQIEVDALLAANSGLNKVVLLAHMQQISIELGLAERLENVDIIVAGGSNSRLFDSNDRPRTGDTSQGEYPQFVTNAGGTETAVVNTDGSYRYVGRLVIDFDANGNIIPESYDETVSGAYATDEQGVADLNAAGLVDPEIQQIVDAIEAEIIATESNVFGVSDVFLNGNRSGTGEGDDPDGVRTQETNLGNLTADANLAIAQEIDPSVVVSIKNGGGIRASIGQSIVPPGGTEVVRTPNEAIVDSDGNEIKPEGGISQNDIATTLAFNNDLFLLTVTREELVALLEHGVGALPEVSGRFPQVSGVRFSFEPDLAEGDRIQSAVIEAEDSSIIAELVRDGDITGNPSEEFRIVTLGFLATPRFDDSGNFIGGGDGYPFPNFNTDPAAGAVGADAARVNATSLEQEGVQTGDAIFADDGTEQDALAEFLQDNFLTTPFTSVDVGPEGDERIQNLNFREDTVLAAVADGSDGSDGSDSDSDGGSDGVSGTSQVIAGTPEDDDLFGDNGNDQIFGNGSTELDILIGGAGDDQLFGEESDDQLFGGDGDDQLFGNGSAFADILDGGAGDDQIFGGTGDDDIFGGDGNDILFGNGSANLDFLFGGDGNDQLFGEATNERLFGGDGNDILFGNGGSDLLVGGDGNDQLFGEDTAEIFEGGAGDDQIFGNGGGDVIDAGTGLDFVWVGFEGDATIILNEGDGYVTVVGFQAETTRFSLGSIVGSLTFTAVDQNTQILSGDDLLAVVEFAPASIVGGTLV